MINDGDENEDPEEPGRNSRRERTQEDQSNNSVENSNAEDSTRQQSTELQRRRTEALERILLASDSNLSLPQSHPPGGAIRRVRLNGAARRLGLRGANQRNLLSRRLLTRDDLEGAIFIPIRTTSTISNLSLPSASAHQPQDESGSRTIRELIGDRRGGDSGSGRRINVGTFFMELTYSTGNSVQLDNLLKNSTEAGRRRMEVHANNTLSLIKRYCPIKQTKLNQLRCWVKTQRLDQLHIDSFDVKPLASLDPNQIKCKTKIIVIARGICGTKWGSPCVPHLLSYLNKKHLYPTCITFQSDVLLSMLIDQLYYLHALPKTIDIRDTDSTCQAKASVIMSLLAQLFEQWNIPILILDSCPPKILDLDSITEFAERFQIRTFDLESEEGGSGKECKASAKRVATQVKKAITECNLARVKSEIENKSKTLIASTKPKTDYSSSSNVHQSSPNLSSILAKDDFDCSRIVINLHDDQLSLHLPLSLPVVSAESLLKDASKISLLEEGILVGLEPSDSFKYPRANNGTPITPNSRGSDKKSGRSSRYPKSSRHNGNFGWSDSGANNKKVYFAAANADGTKKQLNGRPVTSYSQHSDDDALFFPAATHSCREQEKVSELLFNELNQRLRLHGPQQFIPSTPDAGPYCEGLAESEKQLVLSVLQEVTNFEMLKDIRNELKDSKKDLEGRLYGYNPDFSNVIASAEDFLHGKASCKEPCKDELQFYKMPVSFVFSEAEVRYLKTRPPLSSFAGESPAHVIKTAIEESTKLFFDAVIHTTCGSKKVSTSTSKRNQTKAVVVIEDNNEVLELLTVALWFFEKVPLATFQTKYCQNTEEFLLSLDACRFYFGTYPAYLARKDERIYERWLGVGMNGVLRSFRYKILLIDLPRPGIPLQQTRNMLLNRLKIEERLHNIKTFTVGKPSRKEDNLSTLENTLDEIQKCLDPRDKLLFRKARRTYMDLRLYKQIEQKSRQDVKYLKDWGLPEPADDEHEYWEGMRNSKLVTNTVNPSAFPVEVESTSVVNSREMSAVSTTPSDAGSETASVNIVTADESEADESLPTSPNSERIELSEEEDGDEPLTVANLDAEETTEVEVDDCYRFKKSECYRHQMPGEETDHHNNPTMKNEVTSSPVLMEGVVAKESSITDAHRSLSEEIQLVKCTKSAAGNEPGMLISYGNSSPDLVTLKDSPEKGLTERLPAKADSHTLPKRRKLKRSPGFTNLLDDNIFHGKSSSKLVSSSSTGHHHHGVGNIMSITSEESIGKGYTRLEFTLDPPSESSPSESLPPLSLSTLESQPGGALEVDRKIENDEKECKSMRKKTLQEVCVAHLSKWGKSVSRALHRRRPARRIFPEKVKPMSLHSSKVEPSKQWPLNNSNSNGNTETRRMSHPLQVISLDSSSESNSNFKTENENVNHRWFKPFMRYFKTKASKKKKLPKNADG